MATSAAAAVAHARRKVLGYFFAQNAVVADNAQPFNPERRLERRQFERMREAGVIREAKPGRYYVDVPTWHAWHSSIHRRALMLVLAVLVVGGALLFFTLNRG